jgi:protein-L-isoaspartate O-methyltransferase
VVPPLELIHGNGLQIDGTLGQCRVGLDRIYIGAAVEKHDLCQLASLLKPGGILVGPGKEDPWSFA